MWKKCGLFLLSFTLSNVAYSLDYTEAQRELLAEAKKGNAEAQYNLALSLETTTDYAHLLESDFIYWLEKAAKQNYGTAVDLLDDIHAEYDPKDIVKYSPNNTQLIIDEVHKLEKETPKNYALIANKIKKAAELGNEYAISQLTWMYGDKELAQKYGIKFSTIKACSIAIYNNRIYGDIDKEDMEYLCSGDILNRADWEHAQKLAEKTAGKIVENPTALFSILDTLK
ncbi:Uncharacterised protein [Pasteurella multocida]|nr:Uncharacterised protein [Pasteurella multocida]